ncbi:MAG: SDR family oxidoreductase [Candidatus Nitronauta litoralis]|uniref:SDR family oxidoreductase n=1 Tax=Candidatus Nitronauta litoralis TaxID=2705533 RepID=A0A7T0BZ47_9BACT|nr:MAG: SDR family oxidoreductase [Candidatus Nitronauta litoralis]
MHNKTLLITGANSGLGRVSAEHFAGNGAEVILVCRNQEKAIAARDEITAKTGNANLHAYSADLSAVEEVRKLGKKIIENHPRLHILMNNAGVLLGERRETVDGYETTFATNHLAYFLLTRLLIDRLKESAPARIINVSSMVHAWGTINLDDIFMKRNYRALPAYYQSKLANVMFTYALAKRLEGTGVTVNCLHPGIVDTGFGREGSFLYKLSKAIARPFFYINPERGAETQIHLAESDDIKHLSGKYFTKKKAVKSSTLSYSVEDQEKLWRLSEEWCGLTHWPL